MKTKTDGCSFWTKCALIAVLLFCAPVAPTLADGKFFPTATSKTPVIIPHQQAVIAYQDGVETMVIRNYFTGQGDEFAWVVPVPSMPTIAETSAGLFPTLEFLCAPRVVHNVPTLVFWILLASGAGVLVVYRKTTVALLLVVLFSFIWGILLPGLHTGHGRGATVFGSPVHVHSRQQIGAHDVAVISSEDPNALVAWLTERDFAVDVKSKSIIADYVASKWFFCAVKLSRSEDETSSIAPPLAFRFATDTPVYPLRLTGTHEGLCKVDLYVFGPGRAQMNLSGLETVLCKPVNYPEPDTRLRRRPRKMTHVPIVHPKLKEMLSGDLVLTRLVGTLTPSSMSRDALISWKASETVHKSVYSSQAMQNIVLNAGTALMGIIAVGFAVAARRKRLSFDRALGYTTLAVVLVAIVGMIAYHLYPKAEVHLSWLPVAYNKRAHDQIAAVAGIESGAGRKPDELANLRRSVSKALELFANDKNIVQNNFTGQPRIEEDSPGNYTFRISDHAVEYLWYDDDGREHSILVKGSLSPQSKPHD